MINRVYQLSYLTRLLIDRTTCDKVTRLTDREGRGAGYGQEAFAFLILGPLLLPFDKMEEKKHNL